MVLWEIEIAGTNELRCELLSFFHIHTSLAAPPAAAKVTTHLGRVCYAIVKRYDAGRASGGLNK